MDHNNLGLALSYRNELNGAIACHQKAIQLTPDYANAHNNLGNAVAAKGAWDRAIAAYQEGIRLEPKHFKAHNGLAWLLRTCPDVRFRDNLQAIALAKKAAAISPQYGPAFHTLGVAQYRAGDWQA